MTSLEPVAHQAVKLRFAQIGEAARQPGTEQCAGKGGKLECLAQAGFGRHTAQHLKIDGVIRPRLEARHGVILPPQKHQVPHRVPKPDAAALELGDGADFSFLKCFLKKSI